MCDVHLDPENYRDTGVHAYDPQGHTLLVGATVRGVRSSLTVLDLGGAVSIGGVEVESPDDLEAFAARVNERARTLRHRQMHPGGVGAPSVPGCSDCVGR